MNISNNKISDEVFATTAAEVIVNDVINQSTHDD